MLDINFFDYLGPVLVEAAKDSPLSERGALAVVERISKSEGQERVQAALDAIAEISKRANMPDLGYADAHKIPITSFGIVSLGFPVAPTLGEMLSLIRRFHRLIAGPLSVDLEIVEGQAVLAMGMQGFAGPG